MALTNRKRLFILIAFLVISEIFYITLMIKIPDDIMRNEKARHFVEKVGQFIPKIANLQKLAQRDVVPDVMPFFYAVVCLWCLTVGTLTGFICLPEYAFLKFIKSLKKLNLIVLIFAFIGGFFLFGYGFFINPFDVDSQIGVLYIPRPTAAGFGAIMNTFSYFVFLLIIFRVCPVVKYYRIGDGNGGSKTTTR